MPKNKRHIGSDALKYLKDRSTDRDFKERFEQARLKIAIGAHVRRLMTSKKFTIRKLAEKMRSSISQVQRLIEDKNVSVETLVRFAQATGKNLEIKFI